MCDALVGYHAWSGNDYNPAMYRKGKVGPAKQMENDLIAQTAFADLGKGSSPTLTPSVKKKLEVFGWKVYGHSKLRSIDQVRLEMLNARYKNKKNKSILSISKGIGASSWSNKPIELIL